MATDCKVHVRRCHTCNKNKKPNLKAKAGMKLYHAGFLMERVHLDILGPFNTSSSGHSYVIMMVDQFTKWLECRALPDQTAERIAHQFLTRFIVAFECPVEVHTDQGRNFDSQLFKAFCEQLQIAKTITTPYRPCSNGQVERYNRTLLNMIRSSIDGKVMEWDEESTSSYGYSLHGKPTNWLFTEPNDAWPGSLVACGHSMWHSYSNSKA